MKNFILPYGCGDVMRRGGEVTGCPELILRCGKASELFKELSQFKQEVAVVCGSGQSREAKAADVHNVALVMLEIMRGQGVFFGSVTATHSKGGLNTLLETVVLQRNMRYMDFDPERDKVWVVSSGWHLLRIRMIWRMLYGIRVASRSSGAAEYHSFSKFLEPLRIAKDFVRCFLRQAAWRAPLSAQSR